MKPKTVCLKINHCSLLSFALVDTYLHYVHSIFNKSSYWFGFFFHNHFEVIVLWQLNFFLHLQFLSSWKNTNAKQSNPWKMNYCALENLNFSRISCSCYCHSYWPWTVNSCAASSIRRSWSSTSLEPQPSASWPACALPPELRREGRGQWKREVVGVGWRWGQGSWGHCWRTSCRLWYWRCLDRQKQRRKVLEAWPVCLVSGWLEIFCCFCLFFFLIMGGVVFLFVLLF